MKLLITGALGHIGSKLIHSLNPGDFEEVIMLDNLMTQRYPSLFNLPAGVIFRFFQDDICSAELDKYFKGCDVVVHLAAITDAGSSFDAVDQLEEINFVGTQRVADACARNNCKLIFPSTTSIYGTQGEMVAEDCSPAELNPQSPYAASKLKAEEYLRNLGQAGKLRFVICRFGTIFGTSIGMRFHTAINKFCWQAVLGQPITVWRTALQQKRPYLDLEDAIRAIMFFAKNDLFDNSVYNVLTTNTTVEKIISIIAAHVSDLPVEYVDSKIMNQLSYNVSNDRIKAKDFEFKGNMEQKIAETIALFKGAHRR